MVSIYDCAVFLYIIIIIIRREQYTIERVNDII